MCLNFIAKVILGETMMCPESSVKVQIIIKEIMKLYAEEDIWIYNSSIKHFENTDSYKLHGTKYIPFAEKKKKWEGWSGRIENFFKSSLKEDRKRFW